MIGQPRTLLGYVNTVSQIGLLARTLRGRGHNAVSVSWLAEDSPYDQLIPCDQYWGRNSTNGLAGRLSKARVRLRMFWELPWAFDRLHFQSQSLLPFDLDALIYRAFGKRVYFTLHGSEVRSPQFPVDEHAPALSAARPQRRKVQRLTQWSTGLVVTTPDLLEFVPRAAFIPLAVDLGRLPASAGSGHSQTRVLIVHAPSRARLKGTEYLVEAVRRLQAKGLPLELHIIENTPHATAIEQYQQADIIVDQLLIGWYGMLAVEAMALEKPVIAFIREDLRHYAPGLPLVSATPATIETTLEQLSADYGARQHLGQAGRQFVEQFHNPGRVAAALLEHYDRCEKGS